MNIPTPIYAAIMLRKIVAMKCIFVRSNKVNSVMTNVARKQTKITSSEKNSFLHEVMIFIVINNPSKLNYINIITQFCIDVKFYFKTEII